MAIWRITEPDSFFLEKVPLKKDVTHPHKRLQHLAGRYLLPYLFEGFPLHEVQIADTRKPYLQDEQYHFSISHCGDYAAAIVSLTDRVGIDIELIKPAIERVKHKFTTADELLFLTEEYRLFLEQFGLAEKIEQEFLTLIWSAKESIFKWYGEGQMDFRRHMQLNGALQFASDEQITLPFLFTKNEMRFLNIHARMFGEFVLAWVNT